GEGEAVLLDGAELGRRLRADGAEQVVRLLGKHVGGVGELRLALHVAALDLRAHAHLPVGAELELGVGRKVLLPVVEQEVIVGKVLLLPRADGRVVGLRQSGRLHAHRCHSYKVRTNGRKLEGSNPSELKKPASSARSSSTSVRTLWAPCVRK